MPTTKSPLCRGVLLTGSSSASAAPAAPAAGRVFAWVGRVFGQNFARFFLVAVLHAGHRYFSGPPRPRPILGAVVEKLIL